MFKVLRRLCHTKQTGREQEATERKWRDSQEKLLRELRASQEKLQRQLAAMQENALKERQLLISLGNAIKYSACPPSRIESTTTYKRCAKIIDLLSPMDITDARFIRLGRDYDGGYVMVDDFQRARIEAAYSFGICDDVSWDEAIAGRGIGVFMYDHTIERLPKENPNFHFFKTGVTGFEKGEQLRTVDELMIENHHQESRNLIIKMDIEGCEWDVFRQMPPACIGQFSQMVVEFHRLTPYGTHCSYSQIVEVLEKLNQTHQSVHVHANGACVPVWIGGLVLPSLLEVTYVRRADFKDRFVSATRQFPTDLDQPTYKNWPDIYLDRFCVDPECGVSE